MDNILSSVEIYIYQYTTKIIIFGIKTNYWWLLVEQNEHWKKYFLVMKKEIWILWYNYFDIAHSFLII